MKEKRVNILFVDEEKEGAAKLFVKYVSSCLLIDCYKNRSMKCMTRIVGATALIVQIPRFLNISC